MEKEDSSWQVGISRRLDDLGRVVIPIDVRRALALNERDAVTFFLDVDARTVTLKKKVPSCVCCHTTEHLRQLPGAVYVCEACLAKLS